MKLLEITAESKAGFLPYIMVDGVPQFMFMIPSDPEYGGDKPTVAKGGIDEGESPKQAGIREAEEELGLKKSNVNPSTIRLAWAGEIKGMSSSYFMSIFMGEVKDKSDFNKPHFETKETVWLSLDDFKKHGRQSQVEIVEKAASLLA